MSAVINIRGTSGSGKTTVVRRLMEQHMNDTVDVRGIFGGRERLIGHRLDSLFILGNYSGADCGGCDGFSWKGAADDICARVVEEARHGPVVFEGLMCSGYGTQRFIDLQQHEHVQLHILQLTTPLADCLASVQERRVKAAAKKGKDPLPLNPKNTSEKWHGTMKGSQNLERVGIAVEYVGRDAAFTRALDLIIDHM